MAQRSPIEEQTNISCDGVVIRVPAEGCKQPQATISRAQVSPPWGPPCGVTAGGASSIQRRTYSYVAGLCDADEFGGCQYAKGRGYGSGQAETLT